ncbi:MAG TPA: glycogen/starch synthase [Anaerolineales bacterium]|nr:glycogen/starch synthase [Anaerolineales bacterium]
MTSKHPFRVLFLVSEADPLVKVGGLGDVGGSLPPALRAVGAEVRLIIPLHGAIRQAGLDLQPFANFHIHHKDGPMPVEVFTATLHGDTIYLVAGPPIPPEAPVYSSDNNADAHKYTFFSLAALELARQTDWRPDILHANDWHTSPAVYALALKRPADAFFNHTASLLTIHNLPYLGVGSDMALADFGLPPAHASHLPQWANHMALPLGLLAADHLVIVSRGYAQEILTPEFGSGLHAFLQTRADSISGILNGIDTQRWDPAADPAITTNYTSARLGKRTANKAALQAELHLKADPRCPLLAMITRMDYQKGVDLVLEMLRQLILNRQQPIQAVILGKGLAELEDASRQLEKDFPDQIRTVMAYDERLSRRIYAGADALLMPSRYEPCGLAQMIAMRYGCIPIARSTGGLSDTIQDQDDPHANTGFLFKEATSASLALTTERALQVYNRPQDWRLIQKRAMQQNFSWQRSAKEYLVLYQKLAEQVLNGSQVDPFHSSRETVTE